MTFSFSEPAPFLGRFVESGKDGLRRPGVAAFDDKRVVDYGWLRHRLSPFVAITEAATSVWTSPDQLSSENFSVYARHCDGILGLSHP
jgi:hypothetical protein